MSRLPIVVVSGDPDLTVQMAVDGHEVPTVMEYLEHYPGRVYVKLGPEYAGLRPPRLSMEVLTVGSIVPMLAWILEE